MPQRSVMSAPCQCSNLTGCRPCPGWPLPFLPQGLPGRMAVKVEKDLDDVLQKETPEEPDAEGAPAAGQVGMCAALLPCCISVQQTSCLRRLTTDKLRCHAAARDSAACGASFQLGVHGAIGTI